MLDQGETMDLLKLLQTAVADLPPGDHSVGLDAIVRHVRTAIRHLERDPSIDPDSCTDAIYRTNQAYEGSLKEAYRVLAGMDPSGKTPFQIEGYLETNNVVRPRVLTQLTRYRQDYRNPSTHDYKLDFDSDEALLAIVAVCGFAKLLMNQIKSRLASQAALARVATNTPQHKVDIGQSVIERVANVCFAYAKESGDVDWFEFEKGIVSALQATSLQADFLLTKEERDPSIFWDILVTAEGEEVGIDSRLFHSSEEGKRDWAMTGYSQIIRQKGVSGTVMILRSNPSSTLGLYMTALFEPPIYIICDKTISHHLDTAKRQFGELKELA